MPKSVFQLGKEENNINHTKIQMLNGSTLRQVPERGSTI